MISQNNISKAELFNFDTNHKIENIKNLQNQYHKYSGYLNGFIVIMGVFIKFVITIFYIINKKMIYILFQIIFFSITIIISLICIFSSPGISPMSINNKQKKNFKNTNIIYKFKKKYYVLQGIVFK